VLLDSLKHGAVEQSWPTSKLQKDILKTVCENPNVDYDLLIQALKSERTTIITSAHTLAEKRMLEIENTNPKNPKSRVFLKPTDKGYLYAVYRLDADYYKYITIYEKQHLGKLNELIPDKTLQSVLFYHHAKYYIEKGLFDEKGRMIKLSENEQRNLNLEIILQLARDPSVKLEDMIKSFKDYFGPEVIRKAKLALIDTREKIDDLIRTMTEAGI
jgi:hypothetical protein